MDILTSKAVFTPNGVVTYEECAECREPGIKVEHGHDGTGGRRHIEHCPECGESWPIVCCECENCDITEHPNLSGAEE